jgi:hypothetical protein
MLSRSTVGSARVSYEPAGRDRIVTQQLPQVQRIAQFLTRTCQPTAEAARLLNGKASLYFRSTQTVGMAGLPA